MRILFLCRDNGSRSQIAEGLARQMFAGEHEVLSAGIEAGRLPALAIESLRELNIDISAQQPKLVSQLGSERVDLVVVICERDISVNVLPKTIKRLHWPLMDPLDPPAPDGEIRKRMRDLQMALSKHLKSLSKMKIGAGASAAP